MSRSSGVRRVLALTALALAATNLARPQAPVATVSVAPPSVSVAEGATSDSLLVTVRLSSPATAAETYTFDVELPGALGGTVQAEPSRFALTIPERSQQGDARFRLRASGDAPPGNYRVGVASSSRTGRLQGWVALTILGSAPPGTVPPRPPGPVPPGPPPPEGGLGLEIDPPSASLCDGTGLSVTARVTPAGAYRGSAHLRWRTTPAGISVTPASTELPAVQGPQAAAFRISTQGARAARHLLALDVEAPGRGVLATATMTVDVASADLVPIAIPAAPLLRLGAPPVALSLTVQPSRCFTAPSVAISLSGAPPGLDVVPSAASLTGPSFAPVVVQLRAAPPLAAGNHRLVAAFTPAGGAPQRLEIPVKVESPGLGERLRTPRIDQVLPAKVQPGGRYSLELQGQNLAVGTTVSFGDGVQLVGLPVFVSPTRATVEVLVTPAALPGVRVAVATNSFGTSSGPGGVLVETPGARPAPTPTRPTPTTAARPRIDDVQPAALDRGKAYLLKLTGVHLGAAHEFGFGSGVAVATETVTRLSDSQVALKVQVASNATAGRRWAIAYGRAGSSQGPGSVAVKAPAPPPAPAESVPPVLVVQKIILDAPKKATYPFGIDPGAPVEYVVPRLDDEVKLDWHEQNPGTADYFEVRFLEAHGNKVLAKERVDPVAKVLPTHLRPSPALIAEIASQIPSPAYQAISPLPPAGGQGGPPDVAAQPVIPGTGSGAPEPGSTPALAKGPRDLLWEVGGYQIAKGGGGYQVAQGGSKPQGVQVEVSERWPLALAGKPTSLNCPANGTAHGSFDLNNKTNEDGISNHVGDRFVLTGKFSFGASPYAVHPVGIQTPTEEALSQISNIIQQLQSQGPQSGGGSGGGPPTLATHSRWKFDTAFVDWGDGTVEPLVADGPSPSLVFYSTMPLHLPAEPRNACGPGVPYAHCYDTPGNYTVRIYQLAGSDAQDVDPAVLAGALANPNAAAVAAILAALGQGGSSPNASAASAALAAGNRAYMLYCETRTILPPPDPCPEAPLQLAKIEIIGFPGHEPPPAKAGQVSSQPIIPGQSGGPQPQAQGTATSCDQFLKGQARLTFVGHGEARIRWRWEDGTVLKEEVRYLQSAASPNPMPGQPSFDSRDDIYSPVLPVSELGIHGISVEAEVLHDPMATILQAMAQASNGDDGDETKPDSQCLLAPFSAVNTLDQICKKEPTFCPNAQTNANGGLQVGLYLPNGVPLAGTGAGGVYAAGNLPIVPAFGPHASGSKDVPEFVKSQQVYYKVNTPNPEHPCFLIFPTQKGDFVVADTNATVTQTSPGVYSGSGVLEFPLTQGDAPEYFPVPTKVTQWQAKDGLHVEQGQISEQPGMALEAPASEVTLDEVQGKATELLEPTLTVRPASTRLIDPEIPGKPKWTAKAPLSSLGNWIASSLPTPRLAIGESGFTLSPWSDVTIDFSREAGPSPGTASCGAAGAGWTGIHLGQAQMSIYQFEVSQPGASPLRPLPGWVIDAQGPCGKASLTPGLPQLGLGDQGWIRSGPIEVAAGGGSFKATYKGLELFSRWFSKPSGQPLGPVDAVFYDSAGQDEKYFKIPGLGSPPEQDWGQVSLKATNLELTRPQGLGWALSGDYTFSFEDKSHKPFAALSTSMVAFELSSGQARFEGGAAQGSIPLAALTGPAPHLGATPVFLKNVSLSGLGSGERRLLFDFDGTLKLSQANDVLPDKDTHVKFEVLRQTNGKSYDAPSPTTPKFDVTASFPPGNAATSKAALTLEYRPGSTFYCGTVDLSLLGGPGLGTGTFMLGYDSSGKDGWLAHYKVPLAAGAGISIAPPLPINLFSINGGLGYNVDGEVFSNPIACVDNTPPPGFQVKDTGVLFSAGMRAGTTDQTTLTLDGTLTIDPGHTTQFTVDAWLLKTAPNSGPGDVEGVLKWSDGAFRGKFWGGYKFLDDPTGYFGGPVVDIGLGSGENDAAVDLLVSKSGEWHVWAGHNPKYPGGAPVSGRVLFAESAVWLMLGGQGLSNLDLDVGGQQTFELGGCPLGCCLTAYAKFGCGLEMKLNPPGVSGSASADFGISVCDWGSFDVGGNVSLGCCPPKAHVELCVDVVVDEACVGFNLK